MNKIITIGSGYLLTIEDIDLIANNNATLCLSNHIDFRIKISKGADFLANKLLQNGYIYGVTTGYGDNCTQPIPLNLVNDLPVQLSRFHGCGLGDFLSPSQTRAVLAVRLGSLSLGFSGVTFELLKRLELLLHQDILPLIPSEGSVGASGDLTPLSYIAGVIIGERKVWYRGKTSSTQDVYAKLGINPYILKPKEGLALMNGTAVMTALAVEAYCRAKYLMELATRLTAMTCLALRGNPQHFDEYLFSVKPHIGQGNIAKYIREDLQFSPKNYPVDRLQDRYSTRCAPHILGVLADYLPVFKDTIEIEINSANDNPIIDISEENINNSRILHGGHFYGGHIAFVMDSLKNLVANVADLLDRQMATLVDKKYNHGLPANLSGSYGDKAAINHGLKAVQIATSAWTAEALKGTMPASVFSRSTECHNQDKVSMGTIAARDALRILQLSEQVAAAQLLAASQALRIRERTKELSMDNYSKSMQEFFSQIADYVPFIEDDQPLDSCLRNIVAMIQQRKWKIYNE
jgi:histidine ammonia-lyase